MKRIVLKRKERMIVEDKFFRVVSGKVNVCDIFANGKSFPKDGYLQAGDLIGNFFSYFHDDKIPSIEIEMEITALENNTVIEEIQLNREEINKNNKVKEMLIQLIRENAFKLLQFSHDKKGYLLVVLKYYANEKGKLSKEDIRHENYIISKSQFYSIYTQLKKEKFLEEKEEGIYLNLPKVESYLKEDY